VKASGYQDPQAISAARLPLQHKVGLAVPVRYPNTLTAQQNDTSYPDPVFIPLAWSAPQANAIIQDLDELPYWGKTCTFAPVDGRLEYDGLA